MRGRCWLGAALLLVTRAGADELSTADKLRVVYSSQFAWTDDGLPIVTVRVADGRDEVVIAAGRPGGSVAVLPDGEGGAVVESGDSWTVRLQGRAKPAKTRFHVVVARAEPGSAQISNELKSWRGRGFAPRTFEVGSVFGVKGQVLDSRRVLIAVSPKEDEAQAREEARTLGARFHVEASIHPEVVERPRGLLSAVDSRGTHLKNDGILWFAPEEGGLLELKEVDKEGGGRENRRYFGKLYVTLGSSGKLVVVNAVPEDKLLSGLVPAEMSPSAPPEALKAQAVAARNELLAKIGTRHLTDPFRLCSTQHCQVYAGAGRENSRSTEAVKATRGELLLRPLGGLVDAVYSASCGGHTEDNDRAWGGTPDPSLRGKLDIDGAGRVKLGAFERIDDQNLAAWLKQSKEILPYCARPRGAQASFRWRTPIDLVQVAARAQVGTLSALEILERGVSGRVTRLGITGTSGKKEVHGELEVRRALGGLKSALFALELEREGDRLRSAVAVGAGHGHGIGMCQFGAEGMAEAGASYRDILRHYYSAAELKRLY